MTLNFYTLGVIYLVYSFLGWVAETVVATIRGGRFANRGAAAGPFCFIYGTTGVLLAVSFGDLRTEPVYLFFACMMAATVMEWITAKLLELDRGVTLLEGRGGYSGKAKNVILCAFSRAQIVAIKSIVKQADPDAFIIVCDAYEILGEGGKAPATEDAADSGAPAGDENASGEPEDDVVQQNGAAQTPADVASGEDTEKVA